MKAGSEGYRDEVKNPFERPMRHIDRFQQRHTVTAVVIGVVKKFGDDNAGVLVANLAYAAFGAVFPLLLLLVTVLGIVLAHNPTLQANVLHSAVANFPIIGRQLIGNIHAVVRGSPIALTISLLLLVWASTGLAQGGLFTMAQIWSVPGVSRPNFWSRLVRSLAFLGVLSLGLIASTVLASFGVAKHSVALAVGFELLAVVVNVGQYYFAFRVLTPKSIAHRRLWPGAILGGIGWTVLQGLGTYLVGHTLQHAQIVYGTFAIVLGLMAWLHMGVLLSLYAAELNVVIAEHLWPRGMVQPPLTDADRRSLSAVVERNRRRPEEEVVVTFHDPPPEPAKDSANGVGPGSGTAQVRGAARGSM